MEPIEEQQRCLVGLIGAGIGFSLTPAMHELEGDALGLRYMYQTIDIEPLGLDADAVVELVSQARQLGFAGLNITHPCKQIIAGRLDRLSAEAELVGSVNTVVFDGGQAIGHNTDGTAFRNSFEHGLPGASLREVVILGAGGAGSSLCPITLEMGAERVTVVDIAHERAQTLARSMAAHFGAERCTARPRSELADVLARTDGVINATPVGMVGHPGPLLDPALLRDEQWVADIVYRPLETELLAAARARGCRVLDGGGMAVLQAVDAFRLFADREPDTVRMFGHFSRLASLAGEIPVETWWTGLGTEV